MRALTIQEKDGQPQLAPATLPDPKGGESDLVVRVAAAGVNRADLLLDRSHFGENEHGIAGSEFAGTVVEVGAACEGFKVGDRIMALAPACYAEPVKVRHELAMPVPAAMDWRMAASVPAWYMTAHNALMAEGRLQPGENVMVQGATSGVGTAALNLARYFNAGKIVAVARSQEKLAQLARLFEGVDVVPLDTDWPTRVVGALRGTADLIIDLVGGGVLEGNLDCASVGGRVVAAGRLGGQTDVLNINKLALKRLQITGVTFRSRTIQQKQAIVRAFTAEVLPALANGSIEPFLDRSFAFARAAEAHAYVRANKHFGKVIIEVGHE